MTTLLAARNAKLSTFLLARGVSTDMIKLTVEASTDRGYLRTLSPWHKELIRRSIEAFNKALRTGELS